jgi:hypothetical protein
MRSKTLAAISRFGRHGDPASAYIAIMILREQNLGKGKSERRANLDIRDILYKTANELRETNPAEAAEMLARADIITQTTGAGLGLKASANRADLITSLPSDMRSEAAARVEKETIETGDVMPQMQQPAEEEMGDEPGDLEAAERRVHKVHAPRPAVAPSVLAH